jgi:hypothetical protein
VDYQLSAAVVLATIARIDAPVLLTPLPDQHIDPYDAGWSPAMFRVLRVYKGPAMTELRASLLGGCFGPGECVQFETTYRWSDLVGYQVVMFLNRARTQPDIGYVPFRLFVVDPAKGEVLNLHDPPFPRSSFSGLVAEIEAAAAATPASGPASR